MDRFWSIVHQFMNYPGVAFQKSIGELKSRWLHLPDPPITSTINGSVKFKFNPQLNPMMEQMYFGSYEVETVNVMRRHLSEGNVFIDVGANVGYLSAVGLSLVGRSGAVHSFEPVEQYYNHLTTLGELNPEFSFSPNKKALGESPGTTEIKVSQSSNAGWNTIVPGFMERYDDPKQIQTETISVIPLDRYCEHNNLDKVDFLKIDSEGYELPTLHGFTGFLKKTDEKPPILCEIAPAAYKFLDYSLEDFKMFLEEHDYRTVHPLDEEKRLDPLDLRTTRNVLLLPNH